jgi:glucose/arabinose dehydrogenase
MSWSPGSAVRGAPAPGLLVLAAGAAAALLAPGPGDAGERQEARVHLEEIGRFDRPVYVHQPPRGADGQLFVVEQPGRVKVVSLDGGGESPFLSIEGKVASGGERGMLSIAFAPDYAESGRFYVYYTVKGGDLTVEEYRRSANDPLQADQSSARKLLDIEHSRFPNHNGGQLQFGPDGFLYVGTGDGGGFGDPAENAQDRKSLLGKILRIDPTGGDRYAIPDGNPFKKGKGRDEIYALGLRNPWRFSFDRETGDIVIGDVGQDRREEIDYETAKSLRGANFGWDAFEGFRRYRSPDASNPPKKHEKPIEDYPTSGGNCAVTGGYVVRDPELGALMGRYVYADHCMGEIRSLIPSPRGARDDGPLGISEPRIASFGEDAAGHVYVVSLAGRVSRLAPG